MSVARTGHYGRRVGTPPTILMSGRTVRRKPLGNTQEEKKKTRDSKCGGGSERVSFTNKPETGCLRNSYWPTLRSREVTRCWYRFWKSFVTNGLYRLTSVRVLPTGSDPTRQINIYMCRYFNIQWDFDWPRGPPARAPARIIEKTRQITDNRLARNWNFFLNILLFIFVCFYLNKNK